MVTLVRPKISKKNKYWIDKHRYYELKHFCLQYPTWKEVYFTSIEPKTSSFEITPMTNELSDPTAKHAILKAQYCERIKMIEETASRTDANLHKYILKAITEGLSYAHMKTKFDIPCGKDMYYDRYRRFFWLLDQMRE